ncbi:hypothetical protein LSTR_LSTR005899 [Laodelphax striatellus]|uniref:Uncharacterized protein n=1 Tax=Laodelphax striatellus TaxID=195883 RepID=A0A482WRE8_LAOST|nr:hypothetical protein LSTR_LSTR005899 [Laodelphax striatellus]
MIGTIMFTVKEIEELIISSSQGKKFKVKCIETKDLKDFPSWWPLHYKKCAASIESQEAKKKKKWEYFTLTKYHEFVCESSKRGCIAEFEFINGINEEEDLLLEEGGGGFSFVYGEEELTEDITQLSVEDAPCTAGAACVAEPHDESTPPPRRPSWVEARGLSARWDALELGPKDLGVFPLEEEAMDAAEEPAATSFEEALEAVKAQLAESANEAVKAAAGPAAASTKEADAVVLMPSDPQRPGAGVALVTSTGRVHVKRLVPQRSSRGENPARAGPECGFACPAVSESG